MTLNLHILEDWSDNRRVFELGSDDWYIEQDNGQNIQFYTRADDGNYYGVHTRSHTLRSDIAATSRDSLNERLDSCGWSKRQWKIKDLYKWS